MHVRRVFIVFVALFAYCLGSAFPVLAQDWSSYDAIEDRPANFEILLLIPLDRRAIRPVINV